MISIQGSDEKVAHMDNSTHNQKLFNNFSTTEIQACKDRKHIGNNLDSSCHSYIER